MGKAYYKVGTRESSKKYYGNWKDEYIDYDMSCMNDTVKIFYFEEGKKYHWDCFFVIRKSSVKDYIKVSGSDFDALRRATKEFAYYSTNDNREFYLSPEAYKYLEELKKPHQAYVAKGTDWPYFFRVNGDYVKSNTSNWAKYVFEKYDLVIDGYLEPYNGPDKEAEHSKKNGD